MALAAVAFGGGLLVGGDELDGVERFAEAWERGDLKAMHAELSPAAQREHPLPRFRAAYEQAELTATLGRVLAGDPEEAQTPDGADGAALPVTLRTRVFGEVRGEVVLGLDDEGIEWSPELVFAGLEEGERLDRRTRPPERETILAADGTPLSEGPAAARSSPLGTAAAAVAGEVGATDRGGTRELVSRGFPEGTLAGISGLELAFDRQLAGTPGGQLLAVGGDGPRELANTQPRPGKPVRTTLDPGLQQATVTALGATYGGIAVLDARKGSVLALAGIAFSAPQPPGSTFKLITTVAALDEGLVKPSDPFPVETAAVIEGREVANSHDEPCGGSFAVSFAKSCNSVFAPLGAELGAERLVDAAEEFGFNQEPTLYGPAPTSVIAPPASTIPEDLAGDLETGVSVIGQGEVLATPLQMASVAQTIANDGTRSPTAIVRDAALGPAAEPLRVTSPETADTVRELMVSVVESGTDAAADLPEAQVAGKTGTAELGPKPLDPGEELPPGAEPEQKVDAWFTAFAPAEDPRLAVAVMVVNADGDGGEVAAPIAREVLAAGL